MTRIWDAQIMSWRLPLLFLLLVCCMFLVIPCAGCGSRGGSSTTAATGASPGSNDLKDLDQKTPEMVCSEYFEAFRKRDMDTLKRCTTVESFKEAETGIRTNPSYEGVRNYRFKNTTCEKEQAKLTAEGEIQVRGKWVKTIGVVVLNKDQGRWKVIEGKWEISTPGKEPVNEAGTAPVKKNAPGKP